MGEWWERQGEMEDLGGTEMASILELREKKAVKDES